ncbi:hypothetical protein ACEWY4_020186 [Coilia grayii]|uniref:AAA ATPase AAA+ lid domain-containing protein n=1 Tax=Coilia grayii TaxID=363190 RepID=A0ABD1JBV7_9TELE
MNVARPDKISGADINSICQEAGMLAVRENRYIVLAKDVEKAYKTVIKIQSSRSTSSDRFIFSTITSEMNLSEEVNLEDYLARPEKISGADINSICQEAGMLAVRENRYIVLAKDFEKAYKTVIKKDKQEHEF